MGVSLGMTADRKTYFVTGATGFVGGELAHQLAARGDRVISLARNPDRARGLASLGVDVRAGDVTDRASLREPMRGVDGVFHVAGWYKVGARDRGEAVAINVEGTRNVLEAARESGVPKSVFTSTLAVFGDTHGRLADESTFNPGPWLSEYDRTKWLAHYEVALPLSRVGLPLVVVQPGVVYGPGDPSSIGQMIRDYLQRRLPLVPLGAAYCWGHVEDIARGHLQAMDVGRAGESYILAGPAHSLVDVLSLAEKITGIPMPRFRAPPPLLKAAAAIMSLVENVVPVPESYASETLKVAAGITYLGTSAKAQRELGFSARSLEEGLPSVLEFEMRRLGIGRR